MSHYSTIRTRFVSGPHLVAALRGMGFSEVEFYEQPQPLTGGAVTIGSAAAEIILRKKHLRGTVSDIGFRRNAEGFFEAVIEDLDRNRGYDVGWLLQVTQRYAYQVARSTLERQNFDLVAEETNQDGVIHLVLRRQV